MKLLSIRLHPFAGTADKTYEFHDGLNVIHGPNEYGKSTLVRALWCALHVSTHFTPAKFKEVMAPNFPLPGGDHVRVTLRFEADGRTWTLEKTWGPNPSSPSRLQADGEAPIADAGRVQAKLNELLRLNMATWKHVLFTGQAQLNQTIEQLKEAAVDDVHPLLKGSAAIPGDIPAERLAAHVQKQVEAHYNLWDRAMQRPRDGRGPDNPWKKQVGALLARWYEQETVRRDLADAKNHEQAVDTVNQRIRALQEKTAPTAGFVQQGRGLRDGLARREGLQERVKRLEEEEKKLKGIMAEWPGAAAIIRMKEEEGARLGESLEKLKAEEAAARKHQDAEKLRQAHQRLLQAQQARDAAKQALAQAPPVYAAALKELQGLAKRLNDLSIQIEAQKLAVELVGGVGRSVTVQRGTGETETVELHPDRPWRAAAAGRFTLEADGLRVAVQSGMADMDTLFAQRQQAEDRQAELLKAMGHPDLKAAEAADQRHKEQAQAVKTADAAYQTALQGRTPEQWAADLAALDELPRTRDLATIEAERNGLVQQQARVGTDKAELEKKVKAWTDAYTDQSALTDQVIAVQRDLKAGREQLEALPAVPEGFAGPKAYLDELKRREEALHRMEQELNTLQQERARLEGSTPARTAEDLAAELEAKEHRFRREQERGEALLRLQASLQRVVAARGNEDPLKGLREAVAAHFNALTGGRYDGVQLEGTQPVSVSGGVDLPARRLSQGTAGSLALALRLALAELYLRDSEGFLLLDDPFTDMDPGRRAAAEQAIRRFAEKKQVLFLTCHPEHAAVPGATAPGP